MSARDSMIREIVNGWKHISADLSMTEERLYGSLDIVRTTGAKPTAASHLQRFLRGLGILSYRSEYGAAKGGGQLVYSKLEASIEDGVTAIYKHFDAGRTYSWFEYGHPGHIPSGTHKNIAPRGQEKATRVVVAPEKSKEEVRAIAGPEPVAPLASLAEARKDEGEALVGAARQYANRTAAVQEHVEALKGLGVEVDVLKVMEGISWKEDPILEAVASILPIIDRLERVNSRLSGTSSALRDELTDLRKTVDPLRKEVESLKAANKRLSERNVALSAAPTVNRISPSA
jgi:FtsZ-binding cell division protein ZapB